MPRTVQIRSVFVVAGNRETLDGLHSYLTNAGVPSQTRGTLGTVPPSAAAVVLFPDELDASVVGAISAIRAARPKLPLIVVTSTPQRYHPTLEADGRSKLPIVLQKPVFGWTILDALRAHAAEGAR